MFKIVYEVHYQTVGDDISWDNNDIRVTDDDECRVIPVKFVRDDVSFRNIRVKYNVCKVRNVSRQRDVQKKGDLTSILQQIFFLDEFYDTNLP